MYCIFISFCLSASDSFRVYILLFLYFTVLLYCIVLSFIRISLTSIFCDTPCIFWLFICKHVRMCSIAREHMERRQGWMRRMKEDDAWVHASDGGGRKGRRRRRKTVREGEEKGKERDRGRNRETKTNFLGCTWVCITVSRHLSKKRKARNCWLINGAIKCVQGGENDFNYKCHGTSCALSRLFSLSILFIMSKYVISLYLIVGTITGARWMILVWHIIETMLEFLF